MTTELDETQFDDLCPCGCGETLESIADVDDDIVSIDDLEPINTYEDDDDDYDGDYDEDYDEDEEIMEGSTSSCPWSFTVPADLATKLSNEAGISSSDSTSSYKKKMWSKLYPNVAPDQIDPAQAAADYYLLFGIINNSFVEYEPLVLPSIEKLEWAGNVLGKSVEEVTKRQVEIKQAAETDPRSLLTKASKQAEHTYHDMVENLDKCFREYVHMACGGELRHHGAVGGALGKSYRRGAWARWFYIYRDNGPESLLKMAELFEEFTGGSYGGPPWANAARILHQRETGQLGPDDFTNKQLFIDRVFTLEHNGGCFLNKLDWINKREEREYPYNYHFAEMKNYVLEAHAHNPVNIDMLYGYASPEIQAMTKEYLALAEKHDIEIVGTWQGTTNLPEEIKKNEEEKVSTGNIDWSDVEEDIVVTPKVNPLVSQLEESLKKKASTPSKGIDWGTIFNDDKVEVFLDPDTNLSVKWT